MLCCAMLCYAMLCCTAWLLPRLGPGAVCVERVLLLSHCQPACCRFFMAVCMHGMSCNFPHINAAGAALSSAAQQQARMSGLHSLDLCLLEF